MQSLLILSLLLTVWLSRDARTQREPSESKQIAISTSLARSIDAEHIISGDGLWGHIDLI